MPLDVETRTAELDPVFWRAASYPAAQVRSNSLKPVPHFKVGIIGKYDCSVIVNYLCHLNSKWDSLLSWQQKMVRCLLESEFCTSVHIKPCLKIPVWRTTLQRVRSSFKVLAVLVSFYSRIYGRRLCGSLTQDTVCAFIFKRHSLVQ